MMYVRADYTLPEKENAVRSQSRKINVIFLFFILFYWYLFKRKDFPLDYLFVVCYAGAVLINKTTSVIKNILMLLLNRLWYLPRKSPILPFLLLWMAF